MVAWVKLTLKQGIGGRREKLPKFGFDIRRDHVKQYVKSVIPVPDVGFDALIPAPLSNAIGKQSP